MKYLSGISQLVLAILFAWSMYENHILLNKYVALKDKYAVALSYQCKGKETK